MKKLYFILSIFALLMLAGCDTPNLMGKKVKKTYFTGGQVSSEFVMDDDTGQNGLLKKYGYDGKLTSTVHIRNGVKDGVETGFDERGRVIWRYTFVNGRQHGKQYAYYPNGDVMLSFNYVNGLKDGVAKAYNVDGSVNKQVTYKHGKIVN